jgi:hypothetical protein
LGGAYSAQEVVGPADSVLAIVFRVGGVQLYKLVWLRCARWYCQTKAIELCHKHSERVRWSDNAPPPRVLYLT